ncbi:MAG: serine--tRNA ligase [Pseudomonadota bacterium]
MLDLQTILGNLEEARKKLLLRGEEAASRLDGIAALGRERSALIQGLDEKRSLMKKGSAETGKLQKSASAPELEAKREELKGLRSEIKDLESKLGEVTAGISELMLLVPNIPHDSVPEGPDETFNRVESEWGRRPDFDFEPKPHWELGEKLGIIDFERAAKIAGSRFAVMAGAGSMLERSLLQFMLDVHTRENGYREVLPPFLVNTAAMTGTGQLPKFARDSFKIDGQELYLVPTAEVPVTNLHADEIIDGDSLPLRYCAWTPCFRSEAGSHGKDVRGLIRQHQFNKVELVKFCKPENSYEELDLLVRDAAGILEKLGLHHRIVTLSSGDMGFSAAKCYDIEVWLPSQNAFREISSCSNCTDFQARRAKIRYRPARGAKPKLVHTMNGSGLAVGRTLIAIMEQCQRSDGSIAVPGALRQYMGGMELIGP